MRTMFALPHRNPRCNSRFWRRWLPVMLILAVVGGLLAPSPAAGHAALRESNPAANAVLPTSPTTATMEFTERLEPSYTKADLYDQAGEIVPGASSRMGDTEYILLVDLPPDLPNGTYSILWRNLSLDDGHTQQGYIPFTIGTGADVQNIVPPAATLDATGPPEWTKMVSRWITYLGVAVAIAVWPIWLLVFRPAISPAWQAGPTLTRRVRGFTVAGVIVALIGCVASLLAQAATLESPGGLVEGLSFTLGETRYGMLWLLRVGLILVYAATLFAVGWWWPWRRKPMTFLALALGAVIPVSFSLISHAAAQPVGSETAIAADALHLYSASIWAGGLFLILATVVPTLRDLTAAGRQVVISRLVPRFSQVAVVAWAVMALTGIYAAWLEVGNLAALRQTPYGESLTVKLLLLVPLVALGAFNLFVVARRMPAATDEGAADRWSRNFSWAIVAETALVIVVLLVVGLLVGQPPAREVIAQESEGITIPLAADGQLATLYLTPGATGPNHYQLVLGGGHDHLTGRGAPPVEALLRVELAEHDTGLKQIALTPAGGGSFEGHGSEFSIEGDWAIEVIVRQQGQADWRTSVTQPISIMPPEAIVPGEPPRFGPGGVAGLVLLVIGMTGLILAGFARGSAIRREAAGLGMVGLVLGIALVAQARFGPQELAASGGPAQVVAVDPAAVVRGEPLFAANCATCHGVRGRGDGPGAARLNPPPADLTASHALAHTDEVFHYWIENGIAGTGMPGFGDTLDSGQITDVIAYLRDLQNDAVAARDAPGADDCQIAPRTLESIAQMAGTPASAPPTPDVAGSEPADQATIAAINETARELVACSNAGDTMRRLALYSDRRIRMSYPQGPTPVLERMAEAAMPVVEYERVALINLDEVMRMPDGRVSAQVAIDNPVLHTHALATPGVNPQEDVARLVFVQQDGRWLIDGFLE